MSGDHVCEWVCARGARRRGYALHVMVVLFMASWWEAHVFRLTGHSRWVDVRDNMRVLKETVVV